MSNPGKVLLLKHENGMRVSDALARIYKNHEAHDPADIHRARELADVEDAVPIGIFYRNENVPRYEEVRKARRVPCCDQINETLEKAFDKFGIDTGVAEVVESGRDRTAGEE